MSELQFLDLAATTVTDDGLCLLREMPYLSTILAGPIVTVERAKKLRDELGNGPYWRQPGRRDHVEIVVIAGVNSTRIGPKGIQQ